MKNKILRNILIVAMACGVIALAVFMYRIITRATVSFDLGASEVVTNAAEFKTIKVYKGKTVTPQTPESDYATFTGWLRYDERTGFYPFDETEEIKEDIILYADWSLGDTDTDKDGLPDDFENKIGTNPYMADTDRDGVSDYIELFAGTDPLKIGYDSNGIGDYEKCKTGGFIPFDFELDSDNDGASDEWEKAHGFNPLVKNASFEVSEQCEVQGEAVSVEVYAALSGKQAETLSVKPVFSYESSLVSSSIPGYLGCAYEFNVDGDFSEALINFKFDKSVEGYGKKDFQPRIYYINEKTGFLEELPDQEVYGNGVYATVKHFSKYILLDKTKFDAIWTKDIANPEIGKIGGSIIFAVDNSASMSDNDPGMIRYDVVSKFVQGLDDSSRAGLLYYERQSHVLAELTKDYLGFGDKLKAVSVDAGNNIYYSGSSPVNALRTSMSMFTGTDTGKIIVLLSDGKESGGHDEKTIEKMKEELIVMGIRVFCFGFGEDDSEFLTALSEATGGRYYHISSSGDILTADEYLDSLKPKAIDLLEDANGDHLPDYYAQLLFLGEISLKNGSLEMKGFNLNGDADLDGDGILNGDELVISFDPGYGVYASMITDPRFYDTDCDGHSDKEEIDNHDDPNVADYYYHRGIDAYMDDRQFLYETIVENWQSKDSYRVAVGLLQACTQTLPSVDQYMEALNEYLMSYGEDNGINQHADNKVQTEALQIIRDGIKLYADGLTVTEFYDYLHDDSHELIPYETVLDSGFFGNMMEGLAEYNSILKNGLDITTFQHRTEFETYIDPLRPEAGTKTVKLDKTASDTYGEITDALDIANIALGFVDDLLLYEQVKSCTEFYINQIDYLRYVINYSKNEVLKAAARSAMSALSDGEKTVMALLADEFVKVIISKGVDASIEALKGPGLFLKLYTSFVFMSAGTADDMEQLNMLLFYHEMNYAARIMFKQNVEIRNDSWYRLRMDASNNNVLAAVNHILRTRILGEGAYYDYQKGEGLFNRNREIIGYEEGRNIVTTTKDYMIYTGFTKPASDLMTDVFSKYQINN